MATPLIMTITSDGEDDPTSGSDDEAFVLGGNGAGAAPKVELLDPSVSGKWSTAHAQSKASPAATARAAASKTASLDAKLKERAASIGRSTQQPGDGDDERLVQEMHVPEKAKAVRAAKAAKRSEAQRQLEAEAEASLPHPDEAEVLNQSSARSFTELQLSKPLLKAVSELGFATPTPIQAVVMPPALRGLDICASAVTGSGKTAAFLLPALERLVHRPRRIAATRVLVLCPTRELAVQCEEVGRQLARFLDVRFAVVVGGLSLKVQEADMRTRPDVVVATPGRLIDLLRNAASVSLDELEILVLDEADRLLDLGFKKEIEEVVRLCPRARQTMLFSATISTAVSDLAHLSLNNPLQLKVDPTFNVAATLQQEFVRLKPSKEHEREAVLLSLVTRTFRSRAIIFLSSKRHAHRIKILFGLSGLTAAELHGDLTQLQRLEALSDFREGKADFLIATDVAGRGLDIRGVTTVINYELPAELRTYVHRVGRTARAGADGRAVSIVAERDRPFLKQVLKHASDVVRTRTIPPESIGHWVERIASLEEQVRSVGDEERAEKALRVAEMEANKASNMITHRDEIYSRPARSWFQSEAERAAAKASAPRTASGGSEAADEAASEAPPARARKGGAGANEGDGSEAPARGSAKRDKFAGMPRKTRRLRQRNEMFAAEAGREGSTLVVPNQKAIARGAKSAAKGGKLGLKRPLSSGGADGERGGSGGDRKRQKKTSEASPAAAPAKKRDKREVPKKLRSHSKPKFAKRRRR